MFVKGILSTAAQLAQLVRGSKPAEGALSASPGSQASPSPASAAASDAMRQAVAGYDVTDISPRAFSEMLQKLRQSGSLSDKDYQELCSIRTDLERDGADPDHRLNLVDLYAQKLAGIQKQPGAGQAAGTQKTAGASVQRQLEWLQKFARLRSGQGPAGFDTLA